MSAMTIKNYGLDNEIVVADGIFESGEITVAATKKVVRGDLLARAASGKFEAFTGASGQTVVAIYTGNDELAGGASAAADFATRVLISGVVKAGAIKVEGVAATAAQRDLAKAAGIVSVKVTEIGVKDNQ